MFLCSQCFLLEVVVLDYHVSPEAFQERREFHLPVSPCLRRQQSVKPAQNKILLLEEPANRAQIILLLPSDCVHLLKTAHRICKVVTHLHDLSYIHYADILSDG